jgi:hypothetical protein
MFDVIELGSPVMIEKQIKLSKFKAHWKDRHISFYGQILSLNENSKGGSSVYQIL